MAIEHDAQHHLMQLWPEVLGEAALAEGRSAPALEDSEVVSKKATDSSPNSGWRWR